VKLVLVMRQARLHHGVGRNATHGRIPTGLAIGRVLLLGIGER
jgi:hypothetical protein